MLRGRRSTRLLGALFLTVAGLLAGCAAHGGKGNAANNDPGPDLSAPAKPADRYRVTADTAAFFRFSPQQASGPDMQVKKDTRVTLLSHVAGYSKIRLPAGDVGFVDTGDIGHLSPKEIADEDALYAAQHAPPAAFAPITGANLGNGGNYNPPPEAGRAQPLPVADPAGSPTPPPASIFRY